VTFNGKDLREWEESAFISLTAEQRRIILEQFGTEPEPYERSEQDIAVQIRNFLNCGEFEKPMKSNATPAELPFEPTF
jgi:hypothetical protein